MCTHLAVAGRQLWLGYLVALVSTGLALAGTLLLASFQVMTPFALFLGAVMVSAWYGGRGPGLFATLLSTLLTSFFFLGPVFSFAVALDEVIRIATFLFAALLISSLNDARLRSETIALIEREQYAVTLASIGDGVIATDYQGRITFMNEVAEQLTGWRSTTSLGKPVAEVFQIINELSRTPVESPITRTLREGRIVGLANHTLLITRDGKEIPIDDSGAPVKNVAGAIVGAVLVFRDISERRAQERTRDAALAREAELRRLAQAAGERAAYLARASTLLANSLDYEETLQAIARLAVPSFADLCVVFIREIDGTIRRVASVHVDPESEARLQALQQAPINPDGPHPAALVLRTGQPLFDPQIDEPVLAETDPDPAHHAALRTLIPRSHIVAPLIARGSGLGAIALGYTTSGRIYSNEDLALAVELAQRAAVAVDNARLYRAAQDAVQARDAFISLATHEFRSPLTIVLGNAQLLERHLTRAGALDERSQKLLQVVTGQTRRLSDLIATLLDISRLETGQLSLKREPVDLGELVRKTMETAQGMLAGHLFVCETPELPLVVEGDMMRLGQVLDNLLQNAVKYSPKGGTITVRLSRQHDQALLTISDQGVGIAQEALPYIFDRLYRAPGAVKQPASGMGIGLYVVREIVNLHGGTVTVESSEDAGSTFMVRLPLPTML